MKAQLYLLEDIEDNSSRKRSLDCLDQILSKIGQLKKPAESNISTIDSIKKDWELVDKYYEKNGCYDWVAIFDSGKPRHFARCVNSGRVKSAYYRFKKKNQAG